MNLHYDRFDGFLGFLTSIALSIPLWVLIVLAAVLAFCSPA